MAPGKMTIQLNQFNPASYYCRGILLGDLRRRLNVLWSAGHEVDSFTLVISNVRKDTVNLTRLNRIINRKGVIPPVPDVIIDGEEPKVHNSAAASEWWTPQYNTRRVYRMTIKPEVLDYGWAITALVIGYIRQHLWQQQTYAHRVDIIDLPARLKVWWKQPWVDNREVTWYFDSPYINDQIACFASIFSYTTHFNYATFPATRVKCPVIGINKNSTIYRFAEKMVNSDLGVRR